MTTESMLSQFFDSPIMPVRIAAWVISVLLIWFLVSFPARWLWAILRDSEFKLSEWLRGVRTTLIAWKQSRFDAIRRDLLSLIDETAIQTGFEESGAMRTALAAPIQSVLDSAKKLIGNTDSLSAQEEAMSQLARDLTRSRTGAAANMNAFDEHFDNEFRHHSSRSRLFVSLALLSVIIPVNAVMLSQILTETGLLPRVVEGLPFPPSYPVAIVLTMIEAALGWVYHATGARRPSDRHLPRRFSLMQAGLVLATVGAAGVEGFFYGIVAAPRAGEAGLVLQLGTFAIEARYVFAAWGVLIVVVLCGLAAAATSAWFDWVESTALKQLGTQLASIKKSFDSLDAKSSEAQQRWRELIDLTSKCRRTLGVADDASFLQSALEALRHDLLTRGNSREETAQVQSSFSVSVISARVSLFLGLAIIAWVVLAVTGSFVVESQYPNWPLWLSATAAASLGLAAVVGGLLVQPRVLYMQDTTHGLQAITPRSHRGFAAAAAISIVVVAVGAIAMRPTNTVGVLAVVSAALALALLVREISLSLIFVPSILSRWRIAIIFAVAIAALALVALVQAALTLATWLLRLLAQPSFSIMRGESTQIQQPNSYV